MINVTLSSSHSPQFHILIIKCGALGDVLRTTFIARGFKEQYPSCTITWLTKDNAQDILKNNPFVDVLIPWSKKDSLLSHSFDRVISLDDELEMCTFASALQTKKLQGAFLLEGKRAYTADVEQWFGMGLLRPAAEGGKEKADELKKKNRHSFQYLYAEMFHLPSSLDKRPILFLSIEELFFGQQLLEKYAIPSSQKIIGVNTGAGTRWLLKMLSIEKTVQVCHELAKDATVLLLGGTDEVERNQQIKALCPQDNIILVEATAHIREFASILQVCDLIITGDTLALHIALALGKQTLVFFGPTSPWEIEMFGYGEKIFKDSSCLCCYKQTTEKKPSCIDLITPEDILIPAKQRLYS